MPRPVLIALLTLSIALASRPGDSSAQTIAGRAFDAESGEPASYARVTLLRDGEPAGFGTSADAGGGFRLTGVPPGAYRLKATLMGYGDFTSPEFTVYAGRETALDLALAPAIAAEMSEIEIRATRPLVDARRTTTERYTDIAEETQVRRVDTVEDVIAHKPGVTRSGDDLHVRASRSDEIVYTVDGVPVVDPLGRRDRLAVSLSSLSGVNLLSGGYDAEWGNAQAAVVELQTREGSDRYSGRVRFVTDDFGAPDKTFFNSDDLQLGFGGPLPFTRAVFYLSGEGSFSDTYLRTREKRETYRLLGLEFRARQVQRWSGQTKVSVPLGGQARLSGEVLLSREDSHDYRHDYSRTGFWSPTAGPDGGGMWWYEALDSTFTWYGGSEHTPDARSEHSVGILRLARGLGASTSHTTSFSVYRYAGTVRVAGQAPEEYAGTTGSLLDRDPLNHFYVIRGDVPLWRREEATTWTLKSDLLHAPGADHQVKLGVKADLYELRMDDRRNPSADSPLGQFPDRYRIGARAGSFYLQDRFQRPDMTLNVGLRFDAFDPSREAYRRANERRRQLGLAPRDEDLAARLLWQVSPRLGMAYPITDRDVLHFHYGRFQETPRFETLYRNTGVDARIEPNSIVGNPFLESKTSIQYQLGVEHQLTPLAVVDLAFFYKDIFGLIETAREQANALDPRNAPSITYVNRAYGSAQGVELSLRRHLAKDGRWSGSLAYSWQQARGSSSGETQGFSVATGGQNREPLRELPLEWDRPHTANASLYLAAPGVWGVSCDVTWESGLPYTPRYLDDKEIPADRLNSGRLPANFELSARLDKRYRIYRQEFSLFLDGRNLTNRRNVRLLSPLGDPLYAVYYTEHGGFGGAYNLRDVRQDLQDDVLVPLGDPSVFQAPRSFQMGIQFDW